MFSLKLGFKYFRSNRGGSFSFTSILAIIGLSIGVASLIIVMSVMNGFERELQNRILGVVPHLKISSENNIDDYEKLIQSIDGRDDVIGVAPLIESEALISSNGQSRGVIINGVVPVYERSVSILPDYMIWGSIDNLDNNKSVIISAYLATKLNLDVGSSVTVTIPEIRTSILGAMPRSVNLEVVGLYQLNSEIDQSLILVPHSLMLKLKSINASTQSIRIKTKNLYQADLIGKQIIDTLNNNKAFFYNSWKQTHGTLFQAIKLEKLLIGLMLFLIVCVAAIMVFSTIIMTVKSKEREIAILKTLGSNNYQLVMIFIYQGLFVSTLGIFIGILLGFVITPNINYLISFIENVLERGLLDQYFINYFPYYIDIKQVLLISLLSLIISLIACLFSSLRVISLHPVEVLRYE